MKEISLEELKLSKGIINKMGPDKYTVDGDKLIKLSLLSHKH
jgi:hypothetical protein